LVKQKLINRQESDTDRRRLTLGLTQSGKAIVNIAHANAQASLAKTLSSLSANELDTVMRAMDLLHPLFVSQGKPSLAKG